MSSSQQLLPTYCVIVVCGIPGSGKSKLTRWLCSACQDQKIPSHVLSFDDFELPTDDWDAESFMRSRSSSFEALENMLHQHKRGLIFVDDIMFYKSMRKRVYQLARQCEADFATIHVDVPFEVAVSRNNSRPDGTRVQEKSMLRIREHFESPSAIKRTCGESCFGWEGASLTIDGCMCLEDLKVAEDMLTRFKSLLFLAKRTSTHRKAQLKAEEKKACEKKESLEERNHWRQLQGQSQQDEGCDVVPLPAACLLQALDLKIRNVIAFIMRKCISSSPILRETSLLLGGMKKLSLARARMSLRGDVVLTDPQPVSSPLTLGDSTAQPQVFCKEESFLKIYFDGHFRSLLLSEENSSNDETLTCKALDHIRQSAVLYFEQ